ncbi:acyl-CoA dehydrogenase [Rhodococcus qingshengii]|uniref:Acyl-CoA dehydrogenase n=1 Tax=Rhodococcus qingshengii TaxID=334542 RepID=A0AAW6LFP3_RHOSG|nr:acyl-CoA dehydrogenase [Rhodococcus qingshengii]MDE8645479.1 acyl-CoA dehydrogenase [Rhodococcus qingshengii]
MALPLLEDHRDLAEAVAAFANRFGGIADTRSNVKRYAAGDRPDSWDGLVRQGLHAVHLPEQYGGDGAGLAELAVVVEQLGDALYPGPYVPTVIASGILATAAGPAAESMLIELATGATGAVCTGVGLRAARSDAGWTVSGSADPALGLPGADVVLVQANSEDGELWFRLEQSSSAAVEVEDGVDLTRSIGTLTLTDHKVDAGLIVEGLQAHRVELIVNTVLAAEASGIAGWALRTAVDYVKSRQQFGRPVGSFQAVQHKAAMMLVRSEIACAAAWDAARSEEHGEDQQRLVSAQAALAALPVGIENALECVTLLGGIGFTWEHDAHLYWRRAISIAAVAGSEVKWAHTLGDRSADSERDFSFIDPDMLPELREQVRRVLDEVALLPDDGTTSASWAPAKGSARRARFADAKLVAPHYRAPYGLGAGPREQAVIAHEFAMRGWAQPSTVIGEWVLPTILEHGNAEQQDRFVEPSLRADIIWCQLFSEPGAGSDLAGLSTKARKVDGGWVLSGQKVWNSGAHEADWGVCLARSDADAPKHRGLSYFLVDMTSKGIDVRPLKQATGKSEFNEVFLDDVFVPDDCLVAEPGQGWKLAATTLSNERLSMGSTLHHGSSRLFRQVIADASHDCPREDAVEGLGRSISRELALSAMNLRGVSARLAGQEPGSEISVSKVYNALAQREGSRDLLRLLGPRAAVVDPSANYAIDHIGLPSILFGGGTVEIQLNVIAQRVLGLPRS